MRNLFTFRVGTLFRVELDDYGLYVALCSRDWFWEVRPWWPLCRWLTKDRSKGVTLA